VKVDAPGETMTGFRSSGTQYDQVPLAIYFRGIDNTAAGTLSTSNETSTRDETGQGLVARAV